MAKILFTLGCFFCKGVFHLSALILAYQYSIKFFCMLMIIWIAHNIASIIAIKYCKGWFNK